MITVYYTDGKANSDILSQMSIAYGEEKDAYKYPYVKDMGKSISLFSEIIYVITAFFGSVFALYWVFGGANIYATLLDSISDITLSLAI